MKIKPIDKKVFYGISILLFLLLLSWAPKAPINIDEHLHNKQAGYVVDWFFSFGSDEACLENRPDNLRYYGQSVDNFATLINRVFQIEDEFTTRHYIGAIVGGFLLLLTGLLTYFFTSSYWMASISMLLLFISPRPMGQVFGNLKDLPFALGYAWATLGLVRFIRELPFPTMRTTLMLATGIAFSNSVRIGGALFFFYLGGFVLLWLIINWKKYPILQLLRDNARYYLFITAIIVIVGYFGGLLFWPYGLQNPILNPLKSLSLMQHYAISIRQIFEGNLYWSTHLPWYYILKWMLISIPEIVWLSLLLFLTFLFIEKKIQTLTNFILVFCAWFPLVYVIAIDSNLYSGWRQMYFIYPLIIVIASIGLFSLWEKTKPKNLRASIIISSVVLALLPVLHIFNTYPNHYIYFNHFIQSENKGWSDYEYDYYFHGMKEASDWFFDNVEVEEGAIIASNFNLSPYFPKEKNLKFTYVHFYEYSAKRWDYAILSNNYVHPYQLKNDFWMPGNSLKTFYFNNNPLVVILKAESTDALAGLKASKLGLNYKAASYFESALGSDPNNLHLFSNLAWCYLNENQFSKLQKLINEALTINPFAESILLIEAKSSFEQQKYELALQQTIHLLQLNPKYEPAFELLANCYERTGNQDKAFEIRKKIK